ncbi:BadM/Rrf2 family transcriptional regulator [Anseongella ginsenosidimutans]|uniref:BadM/Rrf2 family transcriptional regulator n=1 Tax=Anseongella ginsenosidimutans TaxID=496056 RepID=A0A4R3KVB1_9SPHI|nr:Rrf2 family transcriptional regulator [Anseongella ginsenosidimutans]QEC53171.1 Rrf2 family transcriptional regulator [Anseongella ginsenosidimutans]TCS87797.1 BadM/Rrf2 family transcriptional regulator [Anseongella ginsenosidimutans]
MFTKACEYGIRAMIYITAASKEGAKMSIKDICREIGAPEHFTAKILQDLSRKGLVSSLKGPSGGFFMEQHQGNINLMEIVEAIDGNGLFTGCGLGLKQCSEVQPCPIHNQFKTIRDSLQKMLLETTVQQLTQNLEKGLVFLKKS